MKKDSGIDFIDNSSEQSYGTNGLWHPSAVFVNYMDTMADLLIRGALSKDYYQRFRQIYGIKKSDDLSEKSSNGDFNSPEDQFSCKLDDDSPWDLRFLYACIGKERDDRIFRIKKFCDTPLPGILQNWVQHAHGFAFDLGVSLPFVLSILKPKLQIGC